MAEAVTLEGLKEQVISAATISQGKLADKIESIASGDTITNVDLLTYQMELASNALTVTVGSSVAKEFKDTLQQVVQKF